MSPNSIGRLARSLAQPVTYLGIAMLVLVYCAHAYLLIYDRKDAHESAETRGGNIARVLEQSFSHAFQSIDASLLFLGRFYRQSPSDFDLNAWVHDPSIKNDLTFGFAVIDANGRVVQSSHTRDILGADRSDREYFRVHAESAADRLLIGKPQLLKFTGQWTIILTRRIVASDGTFAGVVAALLDPRQLGEQIRSVELGRDGTVALLGLDGVIRVRAVNGEIDWGNIGRQLPPGAGVLTRVASAKSGTFWNEKSTVDDINRLVSYRTLKSFPLVALVTISEAEIYRHTNENERIRWTIVLLLTTAILAAIGFGARREQRLLDTTSEMKRAEAALRQSQERYRLVEGATNVGIWDWNILTDEQYRSPRWGDIFGCADGELPNHQSAFLDLLHPDDKAALLAAVGAHLDNNKPYALDFRLRCKNGEYRWVHSRGKAVPDATGRAVRMLGTNTDITARKQVQAEIEESRDNLARAEAMALLGHFRHDLRSGTIAWSEGHYRILGQSPETFSPTLDSVRALIHPDDLTVADRFRSDLVRGHKPARSTIRWLRQDGQIVITESLATAIVADDGAVIGYFGTAQDITARKQAEAEIEESRDNLARAEAMAQIGHYKYEAAPDRHSWSDGAYRVMGQSPNSFVPTLRGLTELIHPDDRPQFAQRRRDIMAGLDVPRATLRVLKNDGQIAYVEFWSV